MIYQCVGEWRLACNVCGRWCIGDAVDRIELNGACSAGESCLADNAECFAGRCLCRPGFFAVDNDCGLSQTFSGLFLCTFWGFFHASSFKPLGSSFHKFGISYFKHLSPCPVETLGICISFLVLVLCLCIQKFYIHMHTIGKNIKL